MSEILCPVCQRDTNLGFQGNDLRRCQTCDHIFQFPPTITANYGAEYVDARYVKYPTTQIMSYLRLGIVKSFMPFGTLLDVGYGDGSFVKAALAGGYTAFGYDVHNEHKYGIPVVQSLDAAHRWDVVTFFDSLEHMPTLETARDLAAKASVVIVSFPHRPDSFPKNTDWRHYRPGEHLHYFSNHSIHRLFGFGKELVIGINAEDSIRGTLDGHQNIQTVVFRSKER